MLYTVSDDGSFIANCELYILDKRNAVMQFVIDTGASITCCRAKELGIKGFIPVSWDRMYYKIVLYAFKEYKRIAYIG